jgi:hypothetical protein
MMSPKREPSADIRQAAIGLHEIFTALIDAGFTEAQALTIVGQLLALNFRPTEEGT